MAKLDLPSKKILASYLKSAVKTERRESLPNVSSWNIFAENSQIDVTLLWIQGKVIEENKTDNSFLLDDGSAVVKVSKSSQVVQACSVLTVGNYLMVIGEMVQSGNLPSVKAIKIQDLSDQSILQEMWKYEVQDFINYQSSK